MVNLFKYAGRRIKATFRSGDSLIGVLQVNKGTDYPYWFLGSSYTQGGLWIRGEERQDDIVSVELIEETAMSNKVDLSKYVGKKVEATLRNGENWYNVTVSYDTEGEYYEVGDGSGEDFFYQNGQCYYHSDYDIVSVTPHETNLCNEIPMPEPEPEATRNIDLSQFVGKKVKAKLRGGITVTDRVMRVPVRDYPFTLAGYSYAANGRRLEDNDHPRDIISLVELVEVVKRQPTDAKAIYVARLDNQFICAFPSKQDVKDYVKLKHPDVDPFDVIILTEAFKSES